MLRWILLISLLFLQTACDAPNGSERPGASLLNKPAEQTIEKTTTTPAFEPLEPTNLLKEPTQVHSFETTAEALTEWRQAAEERPTLLLLSNNPHLTPVPEPLRQEAAQLFNNADLDTIRSMTTDRNPSPIMLPGMAVDIALRSGWFRELVWALPLRDPAKELSLERLQSQLLSSGIAGQDEISTFTLNELNFKGTLRDTPFLAGALRQLKDITGPVIVHIDLSYFQPLYKNEISTPLLDIIFQTLQTLKEMNLETLAVTFSYGHLDSQMALDVRFLGDVISYLIEDPARLDQEIPLNWQRQRDALYLENFLQKGEIREIYLAQEKDAPDDAWIKFNLYKSAVSHKEGKQALGYLAQAVKLEPIYALEYFQLSSMAYDKNRPDEALRMLELAEVVFHSDPFLKLQIAQLVNELGDKTTALEILKTILNLEWSAIFYPDMREYLTGFIRHVQQEAGLNNKVDLKPGKSTQQLEPGLPETDQGRQRILHIR